MVLRRRVSPLVAAVLMTMIGAILALMVLAAPPASAHAGHRSARQERIRELGADWWQWALEKPAPINPQVGSYSGGPKCNGASGERGVWFLAGALGGGKAVRHCTVLVGTKLFFPIVNAFDADPRGTFNEKTYRRCVNRFMDRELKGSTTYATVDGKPARPVSGQRADTPVFTFDLPKDNVFGDSSLAGSYLGVADGLWVLEHPLSKGEHTVRFGGRFPNAPTGGCIGAGPRKENITYTLRVVSRAQWNKTH